MSQLADIFNAVRETLIRNSHYSREQVLNRLERWNHINFSDFDDRALYAVLAYIPFYSGMKAKTVTEKLPAIQKYFPDYDTVAAYDEGMIQRIMSDPEMVRNADKIRATISNARKAQELARCYGSFKDYLASFDFDDSERKLEQTAHTLQRTFAYLGPATVHHFLTDIGAKTIKPDRVIMRVLYRLGLVPNVQALDEARRICGAMAEETSFSHRYVDMVLVKFGHVVDDIDLGIGTGICLEANPQCQRCLVQTHCRYFQHGGQPVQQIPANQSMEPVQKAVASSRPHYPRPTADNSRSVSGATTIRAQFEYAWSRYCLGERGEILRANIKAYARNHGLSQTYHNAMACIATLVRWREGVGVELGMKALLLAAELSPPKNDLNHHVVRWSAYQAGFIPSATATVTRAMLQRATEWLHSCGGL